jgi:hypothetical protein
MKSCFLLVTQPSPLPPNRIVAHKLTSLLKRTRRLLDPHCIMLRSSGLQIACEIHLLKAWRYSMLRIETEKDGRRVIVRLIGRVCSDHIEELRKRVHNQASLTILDLGQVDLIDLPSVRFLRDCQDKKVELRNCSPYILEWIRRERTEG